MHLKPRHLRPLSPLLLSFALGCSGPSAEQDLHAPQADAEQGLSRLSGYSPPWLAPFLVKDIHPSTGLTGNPGWKDSLVPGPAPVTLGSTTWFMAYEASTGYELWRTDGTPEGTRLVRELAPGPSSMGTGMSSLVAVGNTLYLNTEPGGPAGASLWKSDGTAEGTVRLALPAQNGFWPTDLLSCNGQLFFQNQGWGERGVWATNGTLEGTRKLAPVLMYPSTPLRAVCADGTLFFVGTSEYGVEELWTSDGTPEGTVSLGQFSVPAPWDGTSPLAAVGSRVFISTLIDGIWTSDGTPEGTTRVVDGSGEGLHNASGFTVAGGTLYFRASDASSAHSGLWTSDGTAAGTRLLSEFPLYLGFRSVALGDTLLYSSGGGLYRSHGTAESTVLVRQDLELSDEPGAAALLADGRWLLAARQDGTAPATLWVSDGTASGTTPLQPLQGQVLQRVRSLMRQADHVLFWADDGIHGLEPWVTDGTPAGTRLVRDIYRTDTSNPLDLTDMGGTLFFSAYDPQHGRQLWKSDGTPEGTTRITDIATITPGFNTSGPLWPTPVGGTLFFFYDRGLVDNSVARSLWKTDGTPEGTVLLHERLSGAGSSATSGLGTTFFFTQYQSALGTELWKSNGTAEGTVLVKDILPGGASATPSNLTPAGNALFFTADDGVHGRELWKTDGTPEGTLLVKDLFPGRQDSAPSEPVAVGGTLFFFASDGVHGRDLWKSDGTPEGTLLVKDLPAASNTHGLFGLVARETTLFFIADDGVHGRELWKSDGTAEGTVMVADLFPGATSAFPAAYGYLSSGSRPLTVSAGTLYFAADDGVHGSELWKSDGTAEGTVLVSDLTPGAGSSALQNVRLIPASPHGDIAFPFANEAGGLEPWTSDGTAEGTRPLADLAPGPISSSPANLTVSGSRLFFVADEGEHGRELWSVKQAALLHQP